MSLNDQFYEINQLVSIVNGIVLSLTDPAVTEVNRQRNIMHAEFAAGRGTLAATNDNLNALQNRILFAMSRMLNGMFNEFDDKIRQVNSAVERSFYGNYKNIIYGMENAIAFTSNKVDERFGVVANRVSELESSVYSRLANEIDASESWLESLIATLEGWTGIQLSDLATVIDDTAGEIYTYIAEGTATMINTVSTWIDEIWAYVGSFIDWVQLEFETYYYAVQGWIADQAAEIYGAINTAIKDLTAFVSREVAVVWRQIINVQVTLREMIMTLEATLRAWVRAGLNEIEAMLADLNVLADWRFQFLNIFMSKPELSFLQVLTRDEAEFQRFKPYWQALFTRIMEPE